MRSNALSAAAVWTLRFSVFLLLLLVETDRAWAQGPDREIYAGREVVAREIFVRFRGSNELRNRSVIAVDTDIAQSSIIGRSGVIRVRARNRDVARLLQDYASRPDVLYAEPNYIVYPAELPNDMFFDQQWGLRNTGQSVENQAGTAGADISVTAAWDITEGSRDIVVAVVDSGIDSTHPELVANLWSAPTAFTVDIDGQPITCAAGTHGFDAISRTCTTSDADGHGTSVAGVIGASGNNGLGVSGVSPITSMMDLKFLGPSGGATSDALAALEFAFQVKAIFGPAANIRILNASWGGGFFSNALLESIQQAGQNDMLFVAASGNVGSNNDLVPHYPSNFNLPNIIAVAATDNKDGLASFSDYGRTTVHLGAPGSDVLSLQPLGLYGFSDGTSLSTPMVSGAAALVLSACPMNTLQLKATLLGSTDSLSSLAGKTATGGRLNVHQALVNCGANIAPSFKLSVIPGLQLMENSGTTTFSVTVTSVNGFDGAIGLAAAGLPPGMTATFDPPVVSGIGGSSTLRLTTNGAGVHGTFVIGITGTSGPLVKMSGVAVSVGPAIQPGHTIVGALSRSDLPSTQQIGTYADQYRLTVTSSATLAINMKSTFFDTYLYLLDSAGNLLDEDDDSGGSFDSRITMFLTPGIYTIEATAVIPGFLETIPLGSYAVSINAPTISTISPQAASPGSMPVVTLTGTRFAPPMTATIGGGITVANLTVNSPTSATLSLNVPPDAATAPQSLTVTTPEGSSNPVFFTVPPAIALGERVSGALAETDQSPPHRARRYGDLYRLTLNGQSSITIDMVSSEIDAYLIVTSAGGNILHEDDQGGGENNARVTASLAAGTYFIEATSYFDRETGDYSLSVNLPALSSITPAFRDRGSSVQVALVGSRFGSPMTIQAGQGITTGSISITSPTAVTATFTVAPDAPLGIHEVVVTTTEGSSNAIPFKVVPPIPAISQGVTVEGSLTTSDETSIDYPLAYADLYRLTVNSLTPVSIQMRSAEFDTYLYLLSETGTLLFQNDDSGGNSDSTISTTLSPGSYLIEASSFEPNTVGSYTLFVSGLPSLTSITPDRGAQGAVLGVTLTGGSLIAPLTINAGIGITVTNVSVLSTTTAIATFTIASSALPGARNITVTTPSGNTGALTFTVLPPQATRLNFARLFSPSELTGTGFAVVNPSSAAANVTFTMYSASGSVIGTSTESIGARSQLAKLGSELFPSASQAGFVRATTSTVGLQGFWVGGDFANFMDGAEAAPVARSLAFPLATAQTQLNIVNESSSANTVTIRLFEANGLEAGAVTQSIPADGIFSAEVSSLFPFVNFSGVLHIRVSATQNIAGTTVTRDFAFAPSWTVLNGIDASLSVFEANFPHVPSGSPDGGFAWSSIVAITNLSTSPQLVTMTFNPNLGAPIQLTRTIPGNGMLRETAESLFSFPPGYNEGWIKVEGTASLTGFIGYGFAGSAGIAITPVQSTPRSTMVFAHVADGPLWMTGLALLNTSGSDAAIEVYVMRKTGALVGGAANVPTAAFTLPPGTKRARLLRELVPASTYDDGFVFVRSANNVPVYGLQLFFTPDLKLIANIAAGVIDPSITYIPPAP